jgi:hypothetical protein
MTEKSNTDANCPAIESDLCTAAQKRAPRFSEALEKAVLVCYPLKIPLYKG